MPRLFVRRSLTAVGIYASVLLGFAATVVAARRFESTAVFGLYTLVLAATGFFQTLFDVTVEEAVVKFGFSYSAAEDWGRLRELVRSALAVKLAGGLFGAAGIGVLAPFADALFGDDRLRDALFVAAAIPAIQSLEGLAGAILLLRGRYDVRSTFLVWSMALRLAAIWFGAPRGLVTAVALVVVAQVVATASIGLVGLAALRRFPDVPRVPLTEERRAIVRFVVQSSAATGVISIRTYVTPLLLGMVSTAAQVSYFRVGQAPQSGFQALSAPARMVLLTEQTRDWAQGRQRRVVRGIRNYSLLAAAVLVVILPPLYWWMPDIVRILYGGEYVPAADAARVFLIAAGVQFLVGWTKSFPVTIGRPGLRIVTHGVESLVIVPLALLLGHEWGATGAAAAVVAGVCVFAALWAAIAMRVEAVDAVPAS